MPNIEGALNVFLRFLLKELTNARTYRIKWACFGVLCFVTTVTAIEMLLKWNKIVGVNSIASTGQYIPLVIGLGSFCSVCWGLVQQEAVGLLSDLTIPRGLIESVQERRRDQAIRLDDDDGIELHSLTAAFSHAFAQPDAGVFEIDDDEDLIAGEEGQVTYNSGIGIVRPMSASP
jgi:hypothetical protein